MSTSSFESNCRSNRKSELNEHEEHLHDGNRKRLNESPPTAEKELHVAPMLDVTYHEFRYLVRLLSKRVILWTEMVVDESLVHNNDNHENGDPFLYMTPTECPIICQLGGNGQHPEWTTRAVQRIASYRAKATSDKKDDNGNMFKYCEINLNCECPSNRVISDKRSFGAILMKKADAAVTMLQTMQSAVDSMESDNGTRQKPPPISVKTRIGVDDWDDIQEFLIPYIQKLSQHCQRFYIHARKVYTQGLNPSQNRMVPPLNYAAVYRLCREFPHCDFWINGGIHTLVEARDLLYGKKSPDILDTDQNDSWIQDHHGTVPCEACQCPFGSCVFLPICEDVSWDEPLWKTHPSWPWPTATFMTLLTMSIAILLLMSQIDATYCCSIVIIWKPSCIRGDVVIGKMIW
uniref:DUS-like FMN-binding domain-containing protein n=1 Tax=Entomoneis paludosa TaxID=265537 RepID=A0A7S2YGW2_9STRA